MTVSREQCTNNIKSMTEKIDKLKNDLSSEIKGIELNIAGLPKKLADEFDKRYATKATENDMKALRTKMEQRNYEWFKYVITAVIGMGMSYFLLNIK